MDNRAVSPVIGAVLMIAITAIVASVAYSLFRASADVEAPPVVGTRQGDDSLMVTGVLNGPVEWGDASVVGCSIIPSGIMAPGDLLGGCSGRVTVAYDGIVIIDQRLD